MFTPAMTMSHPDSNRLAAYAERRLSPAERVAVEDHLADCAECRQDVTVAALVLGGERRRRFWRTAAPLAAAAVVVVALLPRGEPAATPERYRPGAPREGVTTIRAWTPESGPKPRDSLRFVWGPVGASTLYRVTITDAGGGIAWTASTEDTVAGMPDSVRLEPGRRYHWYVDALLADGQRATTGLRDFQISP